MGLRINLTTYETLKKPMNEKLSEFDNYGINVNENSTFIRLALINLLINPPNHDNINLLIACLKDEAFDKFIEKI